MKQARLRRDHLLGCLRQGVFWPRPQESRMAWCHRRLRFGMLYFNRTPPTYRCIHCSTTGLLNSKRSNCALLRLLLGCRVFLAAPPGWLPTMPDNQREKERERG
jgi:hypothetical protein